MKKLTILVLMLAFAWGASAQFYMHVWYNDSVFSLPVLNVDSITFTDTWVEPGEPVDPEPEPEESFVHTFSVSAVKKVAFSKGNLQYTQSTNTWAFAENQWDMIGTDNVTGGSVDSDQYGDSKFGDALADKIDLFGWSTSTTNFGVSRSTNEDDYAGDFVDWGINQIGDDAPNTWRTLSYDEWYYLRYTRTNADNLVGVAQVNGVNGLIFLPDNWTCPSGVTFKFGFHSERGVDYYAAYQTFTADQWSKLEASGAVFLPASGDRAGSTVYGVHLGYYWSATENDGGNAYSLNFASDVANMSLYYRNSGRSVRLVKDVEDEPVEPEQPGEPVDPEPEPEPDPIEPYKSIGIFTVGEGKAISFAPGNLQYTQSTNTWSFAENQWEFIGDANVENEKLANNIDMFGWSTSATYFGVSTSEYNSDYSGSFVDWGTNQIGNDAPNTWRTLSNEEWVYLIEKRSRAERLYGVAQVANVEGLIFLPDNWDNSINLAFNFKYGLSTTFSYSDHQSFTAEQWEILESLGAVFLPAYGRRQGTNVYGGMYGSYWSSTALSDAYAYDIEFGPNRIYPNYSDCHFYGQFVRLVKDIATNETPDTPDTPENTENGYEYVDLGLSVKWATCNVGASKPEEYGDYFAWGEVEPKDTYDWSTYKWCNGSSNTMTKYCDDYFYGSVDNKTVLEASDDAARAKWGGSWRMPTHEEQEELRTQCTWTWTTQNGVNGYKVTSKKNGNSIFLPAAGYRYNSLLNCAGGYGNYWSSSLDTGYFGSYLSFSSGYVGLGGHGRCIGLTVRPVCQ